MHADAGEIVAVEIDVERAQGRFDSEQLVKFPGHPDTAGVHAHHQRRVAIVAREMLLEPAGELGDQYLDVARFARVAHAGDRWSFSQLCRMICAATG